MADARELVQAAEQAVEQGHAEYALQVLSQVQAEARDPRFWRTQARAFVRLHAEGFAATSDASLLAAAREAADKAFAKARGKAALEGTLVLCRVLELQGDFFGAAEHYNSIFLNFPKYKGMVQVRFRASQAFKRCDMAEEALANLQEVLDFPFDPYEEEDILLLLGLAYEYASTKGSKRMSKEAYKQAYKKSREAGRVKYQEPDDEDELPGLPTSGPDEEQRTAGGMPAGLDLPDATRSKLKHVPFSAWKNDPDTWTALAEKCREAGDVIFALDLYTKSLWTEAGQQDKALWLAFADISFLMQDFDAALQAVATVYNMDPFNMAIRAQLGRWDPQQWGAHLAYEEATIVKVQAIVRGLWGRRVAAAHKARVLAERARRRAAAIAIQRTLARGVQGRAKAQRRADQLAAERAAYERWLLETRCALVLQQAWRGYSARATLRQRRRERDAATTIQCCARSKRARGELARLRHARQQRMERLGAIALQRIVRGRQGRRRVALLRAQHVGASQMQRTYRAFRARANFRHDIAQYRGAKQMQRIVRGYIKRQWYHDLRRRSCTAIQRAYRAYACRVMYPGFRGSMAKWREQQRSQRTRFFAFLDSFMAYAEKPSEPELEPLADEQASNNDPDESAPSAPGKRYAADDLSCPVADTDGTARPGTAPAPAPAALDRLQVTRKELSHAVDARLSLAAASATTQSPLLAGLPPSVSDTAFVSRERGRKGVEPLVQWLKENSREAETIWLANWKLGVTGTRKLADTLQSNESVRELGLGKGTAIGHGGAHALAEAMRCHNFRFTKVFVNDQPSLGEQGVLPLMNTVGDFFFGRYSRLEELSLRNTGLGDRCCAALTEGLALNDKLKSLQMENNRIGDAGAARLAEAFERNKTLIELDLRGNKIGSAGAAALAGALRASIDDNALEILRLEANLITSHGAVAMLRYLSACAAKHRKVYMPIGANPVHPTLVKRVRKLCTRLPSYGERGHGLDAALAQRHRKLAAATARAEGVGSGDDDDSGDEDGARSPGGTLRTIGPPFSRPKELPPVKVPRKTSPYLAAPWSPAPFSPSSPA